MKVSNVALVSMMALLGLLAVGCAAKNDGGSDEGLLGSSESLLVEDDSEAADQDEAMESGIEEPLSGADPTDPGAPAEGADDAELMAKVKTNPGKWFKPAGCITTTLSGNVATHVLAGCTGPDGLVGFDGTVTSTYARGAGTLTVTHEASGLKIDGATVSGRRVVAYTKTGTTIARHRTGSWTGTTKRGKAFSHDADFTATWDSATKCITRDGSAATSIASRELARTVSGYERCGIGRLGCPESGTVVLERTKGDNTASVTLQFLGGRDFTVTGPKGGKFNRKLVCNENAT
jgi:hypothetical protein